MIGQAIPAAGVRRPAALIFLHWATLALIALVVGIAFVREGIDEKAVRTALINLHRSLGLGILLLTLLRLGVRLARRPLPPSAEMSPLARLAASATHLALYALLFALPLIGWALSSANGKPVSFFGLVTLPPLVEQDEDLGDAFAEYHEGAAWLLIGLVGVHAAAALFHHFVKQDRVLRAMLPAWLDRRP
ncbi:cytochrome b [Zoogloea sp.]|uniref:cytochrome b n=1 Tax=Zoogloea sp. TaxID=49181 RepID=UPI0035AFAE90